MHDWGAVGLELAQRRPEAVERLVLIDVVPFVPGYRWHPTARIWRTTVRETVPSSPGAGRFSASGTGQKNPTATGLSRAALNSRASSTAASS